MIPPPFLLRSSLNGIEYPGNVLSQKMYYQFFLTHQYYLKLKRKVAQTYFL